MKEACLYLPVISVFSRAYARKTGVGNSRVFLSLSALFCFALDFSDVDFGRGRHCFDLRHCALRCFGLIDLHRTFRRCLASDLGGLWHRHWLAIFLKLRFSSSYSAGGVFFASGQAWSVYLPNCSLELIFLLSVKGFWT